MEAGLFCMDMKLLSENIVELGPVENLHHGYHHDKGNDAVKSLHKEQIGNGQV